MVTISGYRVCQNSEGKNFCSLVLQGEMELVKSRSTGNYYATARKASITSTFDEETCKSLVGTKMPGTIAKEEAEEYEYVVPETGEVILLHHTYRYVPDHKAVEAEVFA